jgi:hypothetical protein
MLLTPCCGSRGGMRRDYLNGKEYWMANGFSQDKEKEQKTGKEPGKTDNPEEGAKRPYRTPNRSTT